MNPFSTELPDKFVQIADDSKAKEFLFALGILSDLSKDITLEKPSGGENDNTIIVGFYGHPTHWILAFRTYGNHDEKENGFSVSAWPKRKFPESILEEKKSKFNLGDNVTRRIENVGEEKPPAS
jgi:hypothetical protein